MSEKEAKVFLEYIRKLIHGKLAVEDMSYRQAAALSQVSSPTLCRFLAGRTCDAITFLKLCEWLKP